MMPIRERRLFATVAGALLMCAAAPVGAQPSSDGGGALTLSQAFELAREASGSLERARLELASARAGLDEARAAFLPAVDASAGLGYAVNPPDGVTIPAGAFGTVTDPTSTFPARIPAGPVVLVEDPENLGISVSVQVDQPLFTWGKLRAGERAASAAVEASLARGGLSERELSRQVTLSFAGVAAGRESLVLVEEIVGLLGDRVRDARARFDAGAATRSVVLAEESREASARLQLVRARQALASAEASLEWLIGREPGELASVPLPESLPDELVLVERSLAGHPRLDELRASGAQAEVGRAVASASGPFRPDIGVSVRAEAQGQRLPLVQANWIDSWNANLTFRVGTTVSLYDGGVARANRDSAAARYGQALSAIAEFADSLPLQVRAAVERYAVAGARIAEARARAAAAEEQRRVAQVSYDNDLATKADLIGATAAVLEADLAGIAARVDAEHALSDLEYLAGPLR